MKNTGDGRRINRVEQEVQKTIAQFLISGFRHPLQGLVTVSKVTMPADLRNAKVYISVLGTDEQKEATLEKLQSAAHEIQNYIGRQLKMRYCPRLAFFSDHTTEQILKIEKIIEEIHHADMLNAKATIKEDNSNDEN